MKGRETDKKEKKQKRKKEKEVEPLPTQSLEPTPETPVSQRESDSEIEEVKDSDVEENSSSSASTTTAQTTFGEGEPKGKKSRQELKLVAAGEMPSLPDLQHGTILRYEVGVRKIITSGGRHLLNRDSFPDVVGEMISMAWVTSKEAKSYGSWRDSERVPENVFLNFLKATFTNQGLVVGTVGDSEKKCFSDDLSRNPIVVDPADPIVLWRRIAELRIKLKDIPKDEDFTPEWEREQVNLAWRNLYYVRVGDKVATERFKLDLLDGKQKPEKFLEFTQLLIDYFTELSKWFQRLKSYSYQSTGSELQGFEELEMTEKKFPSKKEKKRKR